MFDVFLPVAQTEAFWPLLVLLGVVLGMASSMLGIGAGFVSVPVLFGLYHIDFEIAASSSLALLVGNAGVAVWGHWRKGNVDLPLGLTLGAGVGFGALLGGALLVALAAGTPVRIFGHTSSLSGVVGAVSFAVLQTWLGVLTLRRVRVTARAMRDGEADAQELDSPPHRWLVAMQAPPRLVLPGEGGHTVSVWPLLGVGLVAGVFCGLLGVGGGFLMVPALLYWFRARTLTAVGTSLAGMFLGAAIGTVQKYLHGTIDWVLVGVLFVGSVIGIALGLWLANAIRPHHLRLAYGVFCFVGAILALSKLFH